MSNKKVALCGTIMYLSLSVIYVLSNIISLINGQPMNEDGSRVFTLFIIFYFIYDLYKKKEE